MSATRRRRRRSGSLGALKGALWAVIQYNLDLIDNEALDHDIRQRACNALTQAGLAYARVVELHDVEKQLGRLEQVAQGNGGHRG